MEKRVFDPFLTQFWSHNGPISRHFGIWHGPKRVTTGSKWAKTTCLSIPNGPASLLEKCVFHPFLTHFWSHNGPISRHFGIWHGPKRVTTGSKRAKNTCLSIPNGPASLLEKCVFDPFLTHFWSHNGPFSRHFGIFHGPKRVTLGSQWAKNTCLSIPSGLGTTFKKNHCVRPGDPWWTHHWPPTMRGLGRALMAKNGPECAQFVSNGPKTKNGPYLGLRGSNLKSEGTPSTFNAPLFVVSNPKNCSTRRLVDIS